MSKLLDVRKLLFVKWHWLEGHCSYDYAIDFRSLAVWCSGKCVWLV